MLQSRIVDRPNALDVTTCDREPIHVPGAIQPHGVLLVLEPDGKRIVQISENASDLIGRGARELLGERLEDVLGRSAATAIERQAQRSDDVDAVRIEAEIGGAEAHFDAVVHLLDSMPVVELERATLSMPAALETFFSTVRAAIARLQRAGDVAAVADILAQECATIAGFDRTMVYRFDRDWHGEVIAERRDPSIGPFLGMHFPASDIPRQARDLYRRNMLRLIPDARYAPARIIPTLNPVTGETLDMSASVLRSVSPIHLEYLANMGVVASCSASLLKHGELWGLVAMHHRSPNYLPYRTRVALETVARTASLQITALEEREEFEYRLHLRALQPTLIEAVTKNGGFTSAVATADSLLEIAGATGAAIKTEGEPILVGATPRLRHVRELIGWLDERGGSEDEPFVTDTLPLMNPEFDEFRDTACGLLAVPLTTVKGAWLLWFRPELTRTVTWAGRPQKRAETPGATLSPRASFEAWEEVVAYHARAWSSAQIDAAVELRRLLSDVMMRRAREYARLNAELARSNEELESFAHIASHDLREPLRGLSHYATFLREDYAATLDARGIEMLDSMAGLTRRMETQIASMLELARVGEEGATSRATDLESALSDALGLLSGRIKQENARILHPGKLPRCMINPSRAREVFVNLIGNALKYNEGEEKIIEIGVAPDAVIPNRRSGSVGLADANVAVLFVRDNGIGIREKHFETVFRMFKRLHGGDRYGGGTGSGLAITRKIVEQNGGAMWVESTYGQGSTFYFTVPVSEG